MKKHKLEIISVLFFLLVICLVLTGQADINNTPENRPEEEVKSLINAIKDLTKTYGKTYKKGKFDYEAFKKLQYNALTANPLLEDKPILFTVHAPDKKGTHVYMRPHGFNKYGTARMIPGTGKILCILGTHHKTLGGALAILNPQKAIEGRNSIERTWPKEARSLLSKDPNMITHKWFDTQRDVIPWYNSPYPLNEKYFLCVRAEIRKGAPMIYLVDIFGNQVRLYEEYPGCYSPILLSRHSRPGNIPSTRDYKNNAGHFYIQNVYTGTHMEGVESGIIKSVRIVEVLSKRGRQVKIGKDLARRIQL